MSENYLANLFSLKGRVAIVTGAARGNGFAISQALASAGASVVMVDILEAELLSAAQSLSSIGLSVTALVCNLSDTGATEHIVAEALRLYDSCDILVNNAGISKSNKIFDYSMLDWEETHKINLKVPFELSRRAAMTMREEGRGSIINITSLNAELAFPDNPAYVAFKGALKQLTKSLALDLGQFGIRANAIAPGYIRTAMTRNSWLNDDKRGARSQRTVLGRWGEPSDLAGAVVFLASDASSYVTGIDLYVDGGWSIKGL
jgi:NAD(P)-dependent dehydrogenase (short-subunit alcohol dehydrogenase family)